MKGEEPSYLPDLYSTRGRGRGLEGEGRMIRRSGKKVGKGYLSSKDKREHGKSKGKLKERRRKERNV